MKGYIKKYSAILLTIIFVASSGTLVFSAELNSTNYRVDEYDLDTGDQMNSTNFSVTGDIDQVHTGIFSVSNLPLIAGTISTCGKINTSGTYTLSRDLEGISGPCFIVSAHDVVIDGAGYTVTASDLNTSYAVTATSSSVGGDAYGTTTVKNITFVGFEGGINAEGGSVTSGELDGGNGGKVYVEGAILGTLSVAGGISINDGGDAGILYTLDATAVASGTLAYANGGDSIVCGYGGSGGSISLINSSGFVPYVDAGTTNIELVSDGGGCIDPPSGNPGSIGEVVVVNPDPEENIIPSESVGGEQNGISLLGRILPEIKFNINLSPFDLISLPTFGNGEDSFSFIDKIANFLKSDTIVALQEKFAVTNNNLLDHLNIHSVYDLFRIKNNPMQIEDTKKTGLFSVYSADVKPIRTFVTSSSSGDVMQLVRVRPGQKIVITLLPTVALKEYEGIFNGKNIVFKDNTIEIITPDKAGVYQLSTHASPMILSIDVHEQNMFNQNYINIFLTIVQKAILFVKNIYFLILSLF